MWNICGSTFLSQGAEWLKDLSHMVDRWSDEGQKREAEIDLSVQKEVYISGSSVLYGGYGGL